MGPPRQCAQSTALNPVWASTPRGTIASRYSRLNSRRMAAEAINKMFGLDIEVNFRQDYREADDEVMFSGATGNGQQTDMAVDIRTK